MLDDIWAGLGNQSVIGFLALVGVLIALAGFIHLLAGKEGLYKTVGFVLRMMFGVILGWLLAMIIRPLFQDAPLTKLNIVVLILLPLLIVSSAALFLFNKLRKEYQRRFNDLAVLTAKVNGNQVAVGAWLVNWGKTHVTYLERVQGVMNISDPHHPAMVEYNATLKLNEELIRAMKEAVRISELLPEVILPTVPDPRKT